MTPDRPSRSEEEDSKKRKMRSFGAPAAEILRLDFSKLGKPATAQPIEDRLVEARRVVKRLIAIIREHRASARRVGSPLDDEALGLVVRALRVESLGGDYRPLLQHDDPVTAWLWDSLFQELLEEPGNILFTTRVDDEMVRYEAMEAAFWRECLELLEREVAGG
jgi:hypothetical protein